MISHRISNSGVFPVSRSRRYRRPRSCCLSTVTRPAERLGPLTAKRVGVDNGPDAVEAPGTCGVPSTSNRMNCCSGRIAPEKGARREAGNATQRNPRANKETVWYRKRWSLRSYPGKNPRDICQFKGVGNPAHGRPCQRRRAGRLAPLFTVSRFWAVVACSVPISFDHRLQLVLRRGMPGAPAGRFVGTGLRIRDLRAWGD